MADDAADKELSAINTVWKALEPLDPDARQRVVDYVFARLGIASSTGTPQRTTSAPTIINSAPLPAMATPSQSGVTDVRSFAQLKAPKSANERAALVAYFLKYEAPEDERKDLINKDDIKKYFHLARFPAPADPHYTLGNSVKAGYLDSKGQGKYALNAVGYNLISHKLPASGQLKAPAKR